jgi:hypothetical protein
MAKEVIVLTVSQTDSLTLAVNYLLWLTTTSPIPKPNFNSVWTGPSAAETAALQAGTTIELQRTRNFPPTATKAQIEALLQADYTAAQAAQNAATPSGAYYGIYYDSVSGWSA